VAITGYDSTLTIERVWPVRQRTPCCRRECAPFRAGGRQRTIGSDPPATPRGTGQSAWWSLDYSAFGMRVIAWSQIFHGAPQAVMPQLVLKDDLFHQSDILTIHRPELASWEWSERINWR
jgi:hypothetical protein